MWKSPMLPGSASRSMRSACAVIAAMWLNQQDAWPSKLAKKADIGIAVVGAGRIGTLRARLAAKHPAVRFLAISDRDPARAKALAETAGADFHCGDNDAVIAHPDVTAVIVSTPEQEHVAPVVRALALGKPVLVEKPLALTLAGADEILGSLRAHDGDLRVGYSRRYKECFLRAKEQMLH